VELIGENVDRLLTVDMRPRSLPLRGYVRQLHEYACYWLPGRLSRMCRQGTTSSY
jgi:hypothetical protein